MPALDGRPSSPIQIPKFGERPRIVPHEVMCLYVVVSGSLVLIHRWMIRRSGSKASFLFIKVQAMINSLAANFTRLFAWIPGSCLRAFSLRV
jgi:hypothetical protein